MQALSGLAPIRLSYLRLRDQRRNSPSIPRFNVKGSLGCARRSQDKRGKILESFFEVSDN